jgi:TusA-related sulfurtransferase
MPVSSYINSNPDAPRPAPQAFLDAGGATWTEVEGVVDRRMQELAVGEVLEVIGYYAGIGVHLRSWCGQNGHHVLETEERGEKVCVRIRKTEGWSATQQ